MYILCFVNFQRLHSSIVCEDCVTVSNIVDDRLRSANVSHKFLTIWNFQPLTPPTPSAAILIVTDCKALSTLATSRRFPRLGDKLSPNFGDSKTATVAEFGDCSRQCGQGLRQTDHSIVPNRQQPIVRLKAATRPGLKILRLRRLLLICTYDSYEYNCFRTIKQSYTNIQHVIYTCITVIF